MTKKVKKMNNIVQQITDGKNELKWKFTLATFEHGLGQI